MGGKRKKKSLSPNKSQSSPLSKKDKRSSASSGVDFGRELNASQSNMYALLDDISDHDDDQCSIHTSATPNERVPRSQVEARAIVSGTVKANSPPMKKKLPPLVVKSLPLEKLKKVMQAINVRAEFQLTGMGVKLIIKSDQEFSKAKTYLSKSGAEFFTHDVAAEKPFKAVVRGLSQMDTNEILCELKDVYKLQPLAVFIINRRAANSSSKYRDCLYLVHFVKGSATLGALKAVRTLNDCIVKWEAYRGPNRSVTQCMRCLNFGHGTRNCNLKPRCNFCSQHWTENCVLEGACEFRCANCSGQHMSTDKRCPKLEEYQRIRKQATTRNQPNQQKKKKPNLINLDEFPELPPPMSSSGWQRSRSPPRAPPGGIPPGFRWGNPNSGSEPVHQGFQQPEALPTSVSSTIAHLAALVAEMQKMMMQMMQMFLSFNIQRQGC